MIYHFKNETALQRCVVDFLIKCNNIGHDFSVVPNILDHMAESHNSKRGKKISEAKAVGYEAGQSDLLIMSNRGNVFIELKVNEKALYRRGEIYGERAKKQFAYLEKMKLKAGVIDCFFGYDIEMIIDRLRGLYKIPEFDYKIKKGYLCSD